MRRRVLAPARREIVESGEGQHVAKPGQLRPHVRDLPLLLLVLDEHADGLRVSEDVGAVAGRARRVDRSGDAASEREREVEERPLEPRRAEDPERVALANAEREQAVRELVDAPRRLLPRHLAPARLLLHEVRRPGAARRDRVTPQRGNRPCGHACELTPEEGKALRH